MLKLYYIDEFKSVFIIKIKFKMIKFSLEVVKAYLIQY